MQSGVKQVRVENLRSGDNENMPRVAERFALGPYRGFSDNMLSEN